MTVPRFGCCGCGRRALIAAGAAGLFATGAAEAAPVFTLHEVAPGIFVRHGLYQDASKRNLDFIANTGFIVGERAVAVIDPGGSLPDGERLYASLRARTRLPVRHLILSHLHPDHYFGAQPFLAEKPEVIAHWRMPDAIAEQEAYYHTRLAEVVGTAAAGGLVRPTRLVKAVASVDLGGRVLDLTAHPRAHTFTDLTVFDRATATLWMADLLFVKRIPAIDGSLTGWQKTLAALAKVKAARAVPGHGPVAVAWPAGAVDEARYFRVLRSGILKVLHDGGDIEQAVASVGRSERGRWLLFDAYNGRNVTASFKELEWAATPG